MADAIQAQGYPSNNPASAGMAGMLREVLNKFLQNVDGCLPATVQSYDRERNVATVRPIVAVVATSGESVPRAAVASVPVLALGSGEYFINFPLKPGDLGWIIANDRDITLFKQGLAEARPNTLRKHSFEDGLFIPDILRSYTIDAEDLDSNLVVQHKDGKVRVAVWEKQVKITADQTFLQVMDDGFVKVEAPAGMLFDTPRIEFTGTFKAGTGGKYGQKGGASSMDGSLHTTRDILSDTDVQAQTVSLYDHVHKGVAPGDGNTAGPVK